MSANEPRVGRAGRARGGDLAGNPETTFKVNREPCCRDDETAVIAGAYGGATRACRWPTYPMPPPVLRKRPKAVPIAVIFSPPRDFFFFMFFTLTESEETALLTRTVLHIVVKGEAT